MKKTNEKHTAHEHKSSEPHKTEKKKKKFPFRPRTVIIAVLLLAGAGGTYAMLSREKPLDVTTVTVEKGELIQEVSVTGRG